MIELVVVDSTCLIGLERIGRLDILPVLFDPILVPPKVEQEFGITVSWLRVEAPVDRGFLTVLKMLVDEGEAEAIALAHERACRIVVDDRQARSVAKNLGLTIIGTVGILVRAKHDGIISALKPLLDALEANGFFIGHALREEALRLVGE